MAVALLDSPSHGRALLAFSGMDALSAWSAEARPVSLAGPLSARAAVSERANALLVDVAGPAPFAVTGYELLLLASLARGQGPLARDPVLRRAISTVLPESWSFELHESGEDAPVRLVIQDVQQVKGADTAGEQQRRDAVEALARDRVVAQLLPHGLHVSFHDL